MGESVLLGIVCVIGLGTVAQWLAWRFQIPSILLLLVFGFLAGPVTGADFLLNPGGLQGSEWVFAFVSLAIGIILFEGGLTLRVKELREVGRAVGNLITVGVLITWALGGVAAYYLLDFRPGMAVLLGAILVVTGPTVVVPLLRHVRPAGRAGTVAKWEGITIDPVGAILAVLVLETLIFLNEPGAAGHGGEQYSALFYAVEGLLSVIFISLGVSLVGTAVLIGVLRRRLIPDYLVNPVALAVVVGAFALSNVLHEESGLLTTTLMGILMANQPYASVRPIVEFKEDLQVLLIASLFIVLSARLELSALQAINVNALYFLALLILVVRPIAVFFSLLGTGLNWREKAFMSWLAPRGIVAAAVAPLFAFRLDGVFPEADVSGLVPIVYLVIVGTVAVYGLTIVPVGRWLGLAQPDPQGVLFVGAHDWAREMARALMDQDVTVLLVDANPKTVWKARKEGLPAQQANVLTEGVIERLDLGGIGKLVALTRNDEVNSLAALHFVEVFESAEVLQLASRTELEREQEGELPMHLRGRPLFDAGVTYSSLDELFDEGARVRALEVKEGFSYERLQAQHGQHVIPLFLVRQNGKVYVFSEEPPITPNAGDTLIVLADSEAEGLNLQLAPGAKPSTEEVSKEDGHPELEAPIDEIVAKAPLLDLNEERPFPEIVSEMAERLGQQLDVDAGVLENQFGGLQETTPIVSGAAVPHCRMAGIEETVLGLVRCKTGLPLPFEEEGEQSTPVYALFFLVSPESFPNRHLKILAYLASCLDKEDFLQQWRGARNEHQLKETLLHPRQYRSIELYSNSEEAASLIGRPIGETALPIDKLVLLGRADGSVIRPDRQTVLREGDRLTVIGAGEWGGEFEETVLKSK